MLLFFLAGFSFSASAQYYYKDVVGTGETASMLRQYKAAQVRRVALASFDSDNTRSEDFAVQQQFDPSGGILRTTTQTGAEGTSVLTAQMDAAGRVIKTTDSTDNSISTTTYEYNTDGQLQKVVMVSSDKNGAFQLREEHLWQYQGNRITGMLRIRNGKDTTVVSFKHDDRGNIIEEHAQRNGMASEPVYYYYNDKNQLTDIVRFNNKAKRLLPEYMFEYNDAGQVIQRITFPANSSNYTIWRYQYNNQGLRTREAVYNKQKQLTGKIEYNYQ